MIRTVLVPSLKRRLTIEPPLTARGAREIARAWVETNAPHWPGLRAAHLVGGITSMPVAAPFPSSKDVDVHLVFAEGSPPPVAGASGMPILEIAYDGLAIEAGVKSIAEYASPETVLANPEIAYHLTVDSVLFDPDGWLRGLQAPVRQEYPRRKWVLARLAHERRGQADAFALRPVVRETWGAAAELNILGYATLFLAAALMVATLDPPRMGTRVFVHMGELLAARGRRDLHVEALALLGVTDQTPARVEALLRAGAEAFDLAVGIRRSPGPFLPGEHKLHRHLRPYVVDSAREMIAQGYHREALPWVAAISAAATDLIVAEGPPQERPKYAARRAALLRELGFDTVAARDARFAACRELAERVFALAEAMVAANPAVID